MMEEKIKEFWRKFCEEKNISIDTSFDAWSFGNSKDMADELSDLVNIGIKTATTSAFELYEEGEAISKVGDYSIILNSSSDPVCIIQTKVIYVIPYYLITPEHAYHEGEGDRSYKYWRKIHDDYFIEEYKNYGKVFYEQAPMLCEVFEKVY